MEAGFKPDPDKKIVAIILSILLPPMGLAYIGYWGWGKAILIWILGYITCGILTLIMLIWGLIKVLNLYKGVEGKA